MNETFRRYCREKNDVKDPHLIRVLPFVGNPSFKGLPERPWFFRVCQEKKKIPINVRFMCVQTPFGYLWCQFQGHFYIYIVSFTRNLQWNFQFWGKQEQKLFSALILFYHSLLLFLPPPPVLVLLPFLSCYFFLVQLFFSLFFVWKYCFLLTHCPTVDRYEWMCLSSIITFQSHLIYLFHWQINCVYFNN